MWTQCGTCRKIEIYMSRNKEHRPNGRMAAKGGRPIGGATEAAEGDRLIGGAAEGGASVFFVFAHLLSTL